MVDKKPVTVKRTAAPKPAVKRVKIRVANDYWDGKKLYATGKEYEVSETFVKTNKDLKSANDKTKPLIIVQ